MQNGAVIVILGELHQLERALNQSERSARLSAVLAECLNRKDAGAPLDLDSVIAAYPEFADELRSYFNADEQIGAALHTPMGTIGGKPKPRANRETARPTGDSVPAGTNSFARLPAEFGRYRVTKVLGQGAMGAVYLAHDTKLARDVALKTPKLDADADAEMVERFEREARAAAGLHHRNICPVFDVGEIGGVRFLTMAYIEGKPLSAFVSEDKPLSRRQAATIVQKLAIALQEAHNHGVVHRDLKPANVMIDKSKEPVVMDFGLAHQTESTDQSRLTGTGVLLGSPAYMSPEQVSGDPSAVGPETDIYSLGVVLFELLTGRLPYEGSVVAIIGQIVTAEPPDIRTVRSNIDEGLAAICSKDDGQVSGKSIRFDERRRRRSGNLSCATSNGARQLRLERHSNRSSRTNSNSPSQLKAQSDIPNGVGLTRRAALPAACHQRSGLGERLLPASRWQSSSSTFLMERPSKWMSKVPPK